jgi:hypothetical protein
MDLRSLAIAEFGLDAVKNGFGCINVIHGRQEFAIMKDSAGRFQVEGRWSAFDTPEKTFSLHESATAAFAQARSEMVPLGEQEKFIFQEHPPEVSNIPESVANLFPADAAA